MSSSSDDNDDDDDDAENNKDEWGVGGGRGYSIRKELGRGWG